MGGVQEFGVGPADGAIASAPGDGDFAGWARIGSEIFEERLAGHGGVSAAYSCTAWGWWGSGSSRGRTAKRTKPRFEPSNCERDALLRGRLLEPPLLIGANSK